MPVYTPSGSSNIEVTDFDTAEVISISVAHVTVIPMFELIGAIPEEPETPPGGFGGGFDSGFEGGGGTGP